MRQYRPPDKSRAVNIDTVDLGDDWRMTVLYSGLVAGKTGKVILRRSSGCDTRRHVVEEHVLTGEIALAIIAAGEVKAEAAMVNIARGYLGLPDLMEIPF